MNLFSKFQSTTNMGTKTISVILSVSVGALLIYWRLSETKKKLLGMGSSTSSDKKLHPDQLGPEDEPLELHTYQCPMPQETEDFLRTSLGVDLFEKYRFALTRPTHNTHFRVQYIPEEDSTTDMDKRVKEAAEVLEADLRKAWAPLLEQSKRELPSPLVTRHAAIPDVLVVPSVAPIDDSTTDEATTGVVIVDRMCGEAVLKGADIFAKGIFVCSANMAEGDRVAVWCDLDDHRKSSVPSEREKKKPEQGEVDKLEDKAARDALKKIKKEEAKVKAAAGEGAVLRGSSLHKYKGRRLKLGYGVALMSRSEVLGAAGGMAVRMSYRVEIPDAPPLNGLLTRRLYAQQLPSAICAHVLGPKPGERVLDMCAAPGGKTTHLASLMQNKGELIALDHSGKKVIALTELFESLGYTSDFVKAYHMDAARSVLQPKKQDSVICKLEDQSKETPVPTSKATVKVVPSNTTIDETVDDTSKQSRQLRKERVAAARAKGKTEPKTTARKANTSVKKKAAKIEGFEPESFDAILLDPPCSALGLRPRLRVDTTMKDLEEFVAAQRRILWSAVLLLKPGGRLVFSTCTVNPRENEGQVKYALNQYSCLQLVDAGVGKEALRDLRVGDIGLLDDPATSEEIYGPMGGLDDKQRRLVQRFHSDASPACDSVGFFVSKFIKTRSIREG